MAIEVEVGRYYMITGGQLAECIDLGGEYEKAKEIVWSGRPLMRYLFPPREGEVEIRDISREARLRDFPPAMRRELLSHEQFEGQDISFES